MNQKARVLGVIFLIAIYINAIGMVFKSYNYQDSLNTHHSLNIKLLEDLNVGLFANTAQSTFHLYNFNNDKLSKSDNLNLDFKTIVKIHEKIIETLLRNLISDSKNKIIKYRKYDFIYPFHYFW